MTEHSELIGNDLHFAFGICANANAKSAFLCILAQSVKI